MTDVTGAVQQRPRATQASYLVLTDGDRVLLSLRQGSGYYDGHYGLVSGHVEQRESFTDAAVREAEEEIGITLQAAALLPCLVMQRYEVLDDPGWKERIDVFYRIDHWQGAIENREPAKCGALDWYPWDALPANIVPYVAHALRQIAAGVPYCEVGYRG